MVRGAIRIAERLGISPLVVGTMIVSFGTALGSPESWRDSTAVAVNPLATWPSETKRIRPRVRDELLELLRPRLRDTGYVAEAEGTTTYRLPDGTLLRHASDILISKPGSAKQVSVELKYKSAVTDQFKSRAYDAAHMKEQHSKDILTIMVFARANAGISIEHARSICHPFDRFYADDAPPVSCRGRPRRTGRGHPGIRAVKRHRRAPNWSEQEEERLGPAPSFAWPPAVRVQNTSQALSLRSLGALFSRGRSRDRIKSDRPLRCRQ